MMKSATATAAFAALVSVTLAGSACSNDRNGRPATLDNQRDGAQDTTREAARDTGDAIKGAAETFDVKAALMADRAVDASGINVDTIGATKLIVLKGAVATDAQRTLAADIAMREAPGYRVDNQLTVRTR